MPPSATVPVLKVHRSVGVLFALVLSFCHREQRTGDAPALHTSFSFALAESVAGDDADALRGLLAEAERLLPQSVKQRIGRPVVIELHPSRTREPIRVPQCEAAAPSTEPARAAPVQTLGALQPARRGEVSRRILLHPGLVAIARAGSENSARFACGHRSLHGLALATLLHETLHIYDQLTRLSARPIYRHMQQFARQGAARTLRAHNQLRVRSPDIYEFHDISENLAVNFEYFLLDPEFKCRRPAVYQYLSEQFSHSPFPQETCTVNTLVYAGNQPVYLDPARIYQIHYLFAGRGKGIASRFGHSMFRIVRCAATRTRVDERCLEDLHDHIVLSFVANLREDLTIRSWKGLTGQYMSQLLIRPLTEILNDYTEIDQRDLESVPLQLSAQEVRQFIHHALELYWGYSGKYYFFTNNCADESMRLVQTTLPRDDVQALDIVTPRGLRDELIKKHIADASVLKERAAALDKGYVFQAAMDRYEAVFRKFRDTLPAAAPRRLKRYLYGTKAAARREWALALLDRPASLAGMFTMEGLILQRLLKDIERTILIRVLFRRDPRYAALEQLLKTHLRSLRLPWELVDKGYGIPLPAEFRLEPRDVRPGFPEEILTLAMSLMKSDDAALYHEYVETEQNRKFILSEILRTSTSAPPVPPSGATPAETSPPVGDSR